MIEAGVPNLFGQGVVRCKPCATTFRVRSDPQGNPVIWMVDDDARHGEPRRNGSVEVGKRSALDAEHEAERLQMRRQVREREGHDHPFFKIVKLEGLEIAHQDVAWSVEFR